MKATKIMLAFVGTVILTWMFVSFVYYLCCTQITFREACTENGIGFLMLMFGWIPSLVVCVDLDDVLSKQQ